jgi:hypothetical protein
MAKPFQEFPKWVTRHDGKDVIVHSAEHEAQVTRKPEPEPAPEAAPASSFSDQDPRDALRAEATELGIAVDRRWSAERLRREIENARAEDAEG